MNAPLPTMGPAAHDDDDALPLPVRIVWRTIYWTYERATWQYDLMVIAILAFVWLTPPDWIGDPRASGLGPIGWLLSLFS